MTWLAFLRIIGGWRAAAFLALSVALGAALAVQSWRLDSTQGDLADEQSAFQAYRDKLTAATAKVAALANQARVEYQEASARAESNYEAGRNSAKEHQATVVADLRSGNLRLREQWRGCVRSSAIGQTPGSAPSGQDAADELRIKDTGDLVGIGREADNLAKWYQAELTATRQLAESCGKTE